MLLKAMFYTFFKELFEQCSISGCSTQKNLTILGALTVVPLWLYCIKIEGQMLFAPTVVKLF
jgi:hypothetical protein